MSVSQAAMNGLTALMSLGAKSKPIERDSDSFKTVMADASIQHTSRKPKSDSVSHVSKPAARNGDHTESTVSHEKGTPKSASNAANPDSEVDTSHALDNNREPLDKNESPEVTETEIAQGLPTTEQNVAQTADSLNLALIPVNLGESRVQGMAQTLDLSADVDPKVISALAGRLQSESPMLSPYLTGELANGLVNTTASVLEPVGAMSPPLTGAESLQLAQALKVGGVLFPADGSANAEDPFALGISAESEGDAELKPQLTTAVNDKTLLSPSQKVLTAAAIQGEPELLAAQPSEQKASLLKVGPETPASIAANAAPNTHALNSRMQPLTVPVNQPHWAQSAGERVLWMVSQKLQSAEIQLDPPELGPLQVKVSVQHDQVSITFVSHSAQVRDALDQHALRLREMFEGQGLDLVDVDVSDQSFQQREDQAGRDGHASDSQDESDTGPNAQMMTSKVSSQLVDAFV